MVGSGPVRSRPDPGDPTATLNVVRSTSVDDLDES